MQFVKLKNLTLHYQMQGLPHATPLMFANSLGTDFRIWDGVVAHFEDQYTIVRYDKPGHGLSETPSGTFTIHDHAEMVAALLDELAIDSVIFIGISMGGQIAQDFAIRHPERVKALVLCDTAAKLGSDEAWNQRIDGIRRGGMAAMADTILGRWFAPAFAKERPADYTGYHKMLSRMSIEGYISACEAIRDADMREQVRQIQIPSLVLCGAEDVATTPSVVQGLADALPNSQFALIENAGHLPCIEKPDLMSTQIRQFIEENSL